DSGAEQDRACERRQRALVMDDRRAGEILHPESEEPATRVPDPVRGDRVDQRERDAKDEIDPELGPFGHGAPHDCERNAGEDHLVSCRRSGLATRFQRPRRAAGGRTGKTGTAFKRHRKRCPGGAASCTASQATPHLASTASSARPVRLWVTFSTRLVQTRPSPDSLPDRAESAIASTTAGAISSSTMNASSAFGRKRDSKTRPRYSCVTPRWR